MKRRMDSKLLKNWELPFTKKKVSQASPCSIQRTKERQLLLELGGNLPPIPLSLLKQIVCS